MNLPFAGVLESAITGGIIGGVVGGLAALMMAIFRKPKPCPDCKEPLPFPWLKPVKECPKCGCRVNAKGEKVDDAK